VVFVVFGDCCWRGGGAVVDDVGAGERFGATDACRICCSAKCRGVAYFWRVLRMIAAEGSYSGRAGSGNVLMLWAVLEPPVLFGNALPPEGRVDDLGNNEAPKAWSVDHGQSSQASKYPQEDSNLQPSASEADALSN
jgi:hypothetical protein